MPLNRGITFNASVGQSGGGRFGDVQVVAGIAEYNPRRRFAGAARDRDRGRLPRRQHRLEPLDRRPAGPALLGRYHHMEAVGLSYVIDQGGAVGSELCPMAGDGSYISRLGWHRSGNGERGGGKEGSELFFHRVKPVADDTRITRILLEETGPSREKQ